MWPYSSSTSRVVEVPAKPKIYLDLDSFSVNDKALDVTLTPDIWSMVEWLSATNDSTNIDVIRALLFQTLYGRVAFEQLQEHVREERRADALKQAVQALELEDADQHVAELLPDRGRAIRFSRDRATNADLRHVGKASLQRKLQLPNRMWYDLDRQAAKAGEDLSRFVRGLLFKALQGEVNYNQWQYARAELDNKIKPSAKK
jgi:macrodomain Ter protein organizer (MatP/YcbG family)